MKNIISVLALCVILAGCSEQQKMQWQQAIQQNRENIDRSENPLKYAPQDAAAEATSLCNLSLVKTAQEKKEYQHCYQQAYPGLLQA